MGGVYTLFRVCVPSPSVEVLIGVAIGGGGGGCHSLTRHDVRLLGGWLWFLVLFFFFFLRRQGEEGE